MMIIIREVDNHPSDPNGEALRDTVDEAFALCGPAGGLTGLSEEENLAGNLMEGGHEAWDFLYSLRSQAWIKAGADPDVLWTQEQVRERFKAREDGQTTLPRIESLASRSEPFPSGDDIGEIDPGGVDDFLAAGESPMPNLGWPTFASLADDHPPNWDNLFGFNSSMP